VPPINPAKASSAQLDKVGAGGGAWIVTLGKASGVSRELP
jgi:hypothetical protein